MGLSGGWKGMSCNEIIIFKFFVMRNIMIENASLEELVSELKVIIKEVIESSDLSHSKESGKFLTRTEARELLNVSFVTLNKWNKQGVLPAFSVGTRVYYKWEDVEESMKRVA